jgi:ParB-like chromosome segregation protein Spo0J
MGWRDKYKVHPAADVFPMMSDDELAKLGEDIRANGLQSPLVFWWCENGKRQRLLIDGRNRLEAMERAGIELPRTIGVRNGSHTVTAQNVIDGDPVSHIISLNIHRRHLTKQERADLIVAVHKAAAPVVSRQDGGKLPEGRPVDPVKAAAVATAAEHGISQRTVERAIAKAEGREPKPTAVEPDKRDERCLASARNYYASELAEFGDDQMALILENVKLDKARKAAIRKKRASTLPQDGSNEDAVDDPTPGNGVDLGDIPPELDRRKHH